MADLDARLRAAHAAGDRAALVALYSEAAERAADPAARGFFFTHALVFALESGHPRTEELRNRLREMGRDD